MSASAHAAPMPADAAPSRSLFVGRGRRYPFVLAAVVAGSGIALALAIRDPLGALAVLRNAAIVLAVITLVVGVHELAHLVTARLLGIGTSTFSIGFGPVLRSKSAFGVEWQIRALPMGGFVSLRGEHGDEGPGSFVRAPAWKRIVVLLAGPAANVVLAVALLAGLLVVMAGAAPLQAIGLGVGLLGDIVRLTVDAVAAWLPNATTAPLDAPLVGLPGMIAQTGQLLDIGPWMVVLLAAAFSCSAGFLNALPIPPLDGGQAFLIVVRAASRGRANERLLGRLQVAGLRALLVFSVGITALDLVRVLTHSGH
jgi:membrane-associated protease RseP (regulator of RpoE activity)